MLCVSKERSSSYWIHVCCVEQFRFGTNIDDREREWFKWIG